MQKKLNEASAWRIELAGRISEVYSTHDGIKMIALGGSPPRGLSDSYSDLDIIVYWDRIDEEWLETVPLGPKGRERFDLRRMGPDVFLETYYFDTLKVDVAHCTIDSWEKWTDSVIREFQPEASMIKSIGGFIEAEALYGEELYEEWREKLSVYPKELAEKTVRRYMGFIQRGVLMHQGLERGDIIFVYDGICAMLKNILGILGGLNRLYYAPDEPRWVEVALEDMQIKPALAWERMRKIFDVGPTEGISILEEMLEEILDLIDEHAPDIDTSRLRRGYNQAVRACETRPDW